MGGESSQTTLKETLTVSGYSDLLIISYMDRVLYYLQNSSFAYCI